jgi:hypothetical protein
MLMPPPQIIRLVIRFPLRGTDRVMSLYRTEPLSIYEALLGRHMQIAPETMYMADQKDSTTCCWHWQTSKNVSKVYLLFVSPNFLFITKVHHPVQEHFILENMSIVTRLFSENILNQYGFIIKVPLDFGSTVCQCQLKSLKHVDVMEP